jgi:hypothetical protein
VYFYYDNGDKAFVIVDLHEIGKRKIIPISFSLSTGKVTTQMTIVESSHPSIDIAFGTIPELFVKKYHLSPLPRAKVFDSFVGQPVRFATYVDRFRIGLGNLKGIRKPDSDYPINRCKIIAVGYTAERGESGGVVIDEDNRFLGIINAAIDWRSPFKASNYSITGFIRLITNKDKLSLLVSGTTDFTPDDYIEEAFNDLNLEPGQYRVAPTNQTVPYQCIYNRGQFSLIRPAAPR